MKEERTFHVVFSFSLFQLLMVTQQSIPMTIENLVTVNERVNESENARLLVTSIENLEKILRKKD